MDEGCKVEHSRNLHLGSLTVVHPGRESYPLERNVRALALYALDDELRPLR
jgi:hypothetical protein